MTIIVKLATGELIRVEDFACHDSILHLKQKIEELRGIPTAKQHLIFLTCELENDKSVLQIATRAKDGKEWSRFVFLRLKHGMAEAAQEIKRASDHAAIVAIDFLVCSSFE
jgi:hypothetical protein